MRLPAFVRSDEPSVRRPWIGCECPCYSAIEFVVVIIIIIIIIIITTVDWINATRT